MWSQRRKDKCGTHRWLVTPKTGVIPQTMQGPERRLERVSLRQGHWPCSLGSQWEQQECKDPTCWGPDRLEGLEEEFRLDGGGEVTEIMAKAGSWEVLQFAPRRFLVAACRTEQV